MFKVSVIIPVYNAQKYLDECVQSVIRQTYHNLEIILVDDGSTDSSPEICDGYKTTDDRIIVIHKTNGGLSDARNRGLDVCTGDYVFFLDSDDYIVSDAIEQLVRSALIYNSDLVVFNFSGKLSKAFSEHSDICDGKTAILRSFDHISYVTAWSKLYSRNIFDNIRFPVGIIHEDTYVCADILMSCKRIYTLNEYLLHYRDVNTGITGSSMSVKNLDGFFAYEKMFNTVKAHQMPDATAKAANNIVYFLVSIFGAFIPKNKHERMVYSSIRNKFLEYRKELWSLSSTVNKIAIILLSVSPHIANKIFIFYKNIIKRS